MVNFLDLFFPRTCVSCGGEGSYFCPDCLRTVKRVPQVCPVCERPTPFGQTHSYCRTRNSPEGLISLFVYEGIIRGAIHKLKYKFVTDLEKEFWEIIKNDLEKRSEEMIVLRKFIDTEKPVVIPIPLHRRKENFRGFNQSLLFVKRLSDLWKLSFSDKILVRYRNVESQTKLSRKEREENVKGIFRLNPNCQSLITNCLLIDDVWTTGATLKEATRVLKEGGIKKIWGLTIAR